MDRLRHWLRYAGVLAALSCIGAALGFGHLHAHYSHLRHPLSMLGAIQAEYALGFNLFAFLIPAALAACIAIQLRQELPESGWKTRIGAQLLLLAAMGFAGQGLFTLDLLEDLRSDPNRYHAIAWLVWATAFTLGTALIAFGALHLPEWRHYALFCAAMGALMLVASFAGGKWLNPRIMERVACLAWLAWVVVSGWRVSGGAGNP